MDWLNELGWRSDGAVRGVYVQERGAPSLAELAAVQEQVKQDLRELHPRVGLSTGDAMGPGFVRALDETNPKTGARRL